MASNFCSNAHLYHWTMLLSAFVHKLFVCFFYHHSFPLTPSLENIKEINRK